MLWGAGSGCGGSESNDERENARPRRLNRPRRNVRRSPFAIGPASADKISHPTAVFEGLDKITGRIISFEVAIDETVQFGSLQITPRVCYTRPPTEAPRTDVFVEVDEVTEKKTYDRVFTGWMFADSPGLHGVEHPVYDIWLTDCKGGTQIMPTPPEAVERARVRTARRRSRAARRRSQTRAAAAAAQEAQAAEAGRRERTQPARSRHRALAAPVPARRGDPAFLPDRCAANSPRQRRPMNAGRRRAAK